MNDSAPPERLAVLGTPISHSKSPAVHAAAYRELGLDWEYGRDEIEVSELEGFLASRGSEWRGLSITMPLKAEAHRLAVMLDPLAKQTGVVNTLFKLSGAAGWAGFNTDVSGLASAVRGAGLDASRTVVLGAGATAMSAVLAALGLGAERALVLARRVEAATALTARLRDGFDDDSPSELSALSLLDLDIGARVAEFAPTLVISALPSEAGESVALPEALMSAPLFDVLYEPWPSPLAKRWQEVGGEAHPGFGMLVEQALLQVRIFVGGDPSVPLDDEGRVLAAMRAAAGQ